MPILPPDALEFISRSESQTRRAGMRLGELLQAGDLVCLVGDLGAGKTTLVQGIAAGWGSLDAASSPTFVLVNVYRRPDGQRLYHLDAYRLGSPAEAGAASSAGAVNPAEELDLDGLLEQGPLVVEWADRIQPALPGEAVRIFLKWVADEQRDLIFMAYGSRSQQILAEFRRRLFGTV